MAKKLEVGDTVRVEAVTYSPRLVAYIPLNGKVGTVVDAGRCNQTLNKGVVVGEIMDDIEIKFEVTPNMVCIDQHTHKFCASELELVLEKGIRDE